MTDMEAVLGEIRQSRQQMSEECGHDPATFIAYMKKFNEKYSAQVERYRKEHPPTLAESAPVDD
jgi:hypothetical protein